MKGYKFILRKTHILNALHSAVVLFILSINIITCGKKVKFERRAMGLVVVVSLPLILFILALALACYMLGRAKGRRQAQQTYGSPAPPPLVQVKPPEA
ncbi:hypothetical protein RIF29_39956 [Crotalaria pallida]|uniref:Transmembrane protein n=1 Tax=Crotalaria pallida TaxID=3830 RepID=A0AAN9E8I8_CROPI